ncbi:MAG: hypothetical protein JJU02_10785 [Cryomorphaceae bacterium]|nr:hypothetical protein [Cryomorphaceae bacterium]
MNKLLFGSMLGCIMFASCSKEDSLKDSSDLANSTLEMSVQQTDNIIEHFSVYGDVSIAPQSFIEESALYPDLANDDEITLYLLDEAITGNEWQIYVYEGDDVEYDFGIAFDYLYDTGTVNGHTYVTCPQKGANCAEGTAQNGACILIKKLEVDL